MFIVRPVLLWMVDYKFFVKIYLLFYVEYRMRASRLRTIQFTISLQLVSIGTVLYVTSYKIQDKITREIPIVFTLRYIRWSSLSSQSVPPHPTASCLRLLLRARFGWDSFYAVVAMASLWRL